jgi:hypothetical protein
VSLGQPDWNEQVFPVELTRDQIKNSPDIDTEQPVSRQQELDLNLYFQWPTYWASPFSPSPGAYAAVATDLETIKEREAVATARRKEAEKYVDKDSQVRRGKEVIGYRVDGSDGLLGQVEDFILEDRSWKIWYLVLDADDLVNDKLVLISPLWIQWIRFDAKNVRIDLPRQNIIDCPAFDPSKPIRQEQEEVLHDFHGKPYYWNKRSLKN